MSGAYLSRADWFRLNADARQIANESDRRLRSLLGSVQGSVFAGDGLAYLIVDPAELEAAASHINVELDVQPLAGRR